MDLQQLRYVVAVAEEGNFTRAAERCFVVQSALSHQIKALETEIGTPLFARTSRRVEITAAGTAFLKEARVALAAAERASAAASAAIGEIRGELSIGVIPTVTAVDVPAVFADFRAAHPHVKVRLRTGSSDVFMADLAAGRLDVALLGLSDAVPPPAASRELRRARLIALVPSSHELASRDRVRLDDLADEVFVDFPEGSSGRLQSDVAFASAGVRRDVAYETMTAEMIVSIVRAGLALAFLPPAIAAADPLIHVANIDDGPARVEYLAWSEFNPSPAALAFVELVVESA